jgi:hypothetical protein
MLIDNLAGRIGLDHLYRCEPVESYVPERSVRNHRRAGAVECYELAIGIAASSAACWNGPSWWKRLRCFPIMRPCAAVGRALLASDRLSSALVILRPRSAER